MSAQGQQRFNLQLADLPYASNMIQFSQVYKHHFLGLFPSVIHVFPHVGYTESGPLQPRLAGVRDRVCARVRWVCVPLRGTVPRLTGIDPNHRKARRTEGGPQRHRPPSCCVHPHAIGARLTPPCGDVGTPGRLMRHGPAFALPITVQRVLVDITTG